MRGFNMHLSSLRNIYSNRDLHGLDGPAKSLKYESAFIEQLDAYTVKSDENLQKQSTNAKGETVDANASKSKEPTRMEGPYKHTYPRHFKEAIVEFARSNGIKATCKKFAVTRKNVERWCKNGLDRKKGAGRKTTNPAMEVEILGWVENYIQREGRLPKRNYIIIRAMEFADSGFKASKGWCDKFLKRNKSTLDKYLAEAEAEESDESEKP